jgi:hypothetical protein
VGNTFSRRSDRDEEDDEYRERILDEDPMLLLGRARWLCGGRPGPAPECLPPDVEREAVAAFRELADELEARAPRGRAPQVTLEALIQAVRQGGVAALKEPINQVRLRTLAPRQRDEINRRIAKLLEDGHAGDGA